LKAFKFHDLQLLVQDARQCLQMNFEAVHGHCMEIYESALVWIPKNSLIRKTYTADVSRVPRVIVGLSDSWGSAELNMQNGSGVRSVAFSQDGSRVVSGSDDKMVRIWNVTTGGVEAELKGHTDRVTYVAFSQDGSRVFSGTEDNRVRIWNVMMGEVEAELKCHKNSPVTSVALSQDGSRVVSARSDGGTVRIWNVTTGKVEAELKSHTDSVTFIAFSQDGSQVIYGSHDCMVRIWNVITGKVEAELKGHTDRVRSVAFSQNGSRVISGSDDKTVRIWNVTTGKVEAELKGHTDWVRSVAFSRDGSQVVSGSDDNTVRIWNVMTDNSQLIFASNILLPDDSRVKRTTLGNFRRIWKVTTGKVEVDLKGHTNSVMSVAFSQDGSRVVSGSIDRTVRIWNVTSGKVEAELKGHTHWVMSVAFSQDGSQVVSGSDDRTVRIWNVTTGDSQSIFASDITLPDGSRVNKTSPGDFRIFYPLQQPTPSLNSYTQLSDDGHWIMANLRDCCIPSEYRNFRCSSIWGSRICLGYDSGRVVILDITATL
jgi:WD40 repeat protein